MSLEGFIEDNREVYKDILYAIKDYADSVPFADWSEEDKQYLRDNDLEEILDILEYEDALQDFHPIW